MSNQNAPGYTWPVVVRVTHWLVAILFLANQFLTEGGDKLHEYFGWTIIGLISLRLLYGLTFAQKPARLKDLVPDTKGILSHLTELKERTHTTYGHNAMGLIAVWAMWTLLISAAVTGWLQDTDFGFDYGVYEWHAMIVKTLLYLTGVHAVAVVLTSLRLRINLVRSML